MGRPYKDITGETFGTLFVLNVAKRGGHEIIWKLKCLKCMDFCFATSSDLKRGRRQFCKFCREEIAKASPYKCLYGTYKRNANRMKRTWQLSFKSFCHIISLPCKYCGSVPMQLFKKKEARRGLVYNGIDRVNQAVGYTTKNVVPCCKYCNFAKNKWPVKDFTEWLNRVRSSPMVFKV